MDFERVMCKIILDRSIAQVNCGICADTDSIRDFMFIHSPSQARKNPELSSSLRLLPSPDVPQRRLATFRGLVPYAEYSFDDSLSAFSFVTHLTCPEAVEVLDMPCANV